MAEKFALDQIFGEGGGIDHDKGLVLAAAGALDRARDQLLAGAGTAPDQHGGAAGGHLFDHRVDRPHRLAVADHLGRDGDAVERLLQPGVFRHQPGAFFMLAQPQRNRFRHQVGDDFEQIEVAFEVGAGKHFAVDAHGADHFVLVQDRHADEGDVGVAAACAGAVEKFGFAGDVGDDPGLAGQGDLSGDAFAEMGGFDIEQFAAPQGDGAAQEPHLTVQDAEHELQHRGDVLLTQHGLTDLVQHGHLKIFATVHETFLSIFRTGTLPVVVRRRKRPDCRSRIANPAVQPMRLNADWAFNPASCSFYNFRG